VEDAVSLRRRLPAEAPDHECDHHEYHDGHRRLRRPSSLPQTPLRRGREVPLATILLARRGGVAVPARSAVERVRTDRSTPSMFRRCPSSSSWPRRFQIVSRSHLLCKSSAPHRPSQALAERGHAAKEREPRPPSSRAHRALAHVKLEPSRAPLANDDGARSSRPRDGLTADYVALRGHLPALRATIGLLGDSAVPSAMCRKLTHNSPPG